MGLTVLTLEVANPANPSQTEAVEFLIDSGAIYSVVPRLVLNRLGIAPVDEQSFRLAAGGFIRRQTGGALFIYGDKRGVAVVVFGEEGDSTLLGAHTLEALGLSLDPIRRQLHPLPMMLAAIESSDPDLVTVYRSMDETAEDDCRTIIDLLSASGLSPVMLDDSAPGVPEGVYEVCVLKDQAAEAERLIAENPLPDEVEEVDASPELDTETIYHSEASPTAEVEALGIKAVLEANGIAAIVVGDSILPNLPFEVRVAKEYAARARQLVAEAQVGGPAAADEAESLTERAGPPPEA